MCKTTKRIMRIGHTKLVDTYRVNVKNEMTLQISPKYGVRMWKRYKIKEAEMEVWWDESRKEVLIGVRVQFPFPVIGAHINRLYVCVFVIISFVSMAVVVQTHSW
jgi:hypothetical protein